PYRVVCAIGLDQGSLPGLSRPHEFDLMAAHPRPLDRQRQSDDRNLFLDQLLAARQTLHLSYVGRSVRDNAPLPPSVLLAELLDHLTLVIADDPTLPESLSAARDLLVIEHPLQPFSERSFPDAAKDGPKSKIASYNAEYAAALRARAGAVPRQLAHASLNSELNTDDGSEDADDQRDLAPEYSAVFFAHALPEPEAQLRSLTLDALERFLRNPCRELLERRLGLQLPRRDQELRDDESFLPDWQDRNDLSARLLPLLIDGADLQRVEQLAQAGTEVPPGALGLVGLRQTLHQMQQFAAQVRPMLREPVLAPHLACIELTVQGELWRLDASFSDLRAPGLVRYRDRLASPSDYLSAWLHQLVLWIFPPVNLNPQVCWVLRDTSIRFARNQDPRELLGQLIALYRQGMREPLAFFPKTSMAFANANWQFSSKVHSIWAGASHGERTVPGERDDPAVRLAWRGVPDPVRSGIPAFEQCARTVFEPLLAQLRHD
ncbi:MAG: exodeoxyribonuclease V subunit gamma, partial [Quisquiliibacterium sp.]